MKLKFIPACSTEFTHEIDNIIFTAGESTSWYYEDGGFGDYIIDLGRLRSHEESGEESIEKPAAEIATLLDSMPTLSGWRSLSLLHVKGS